MKRPLPISRAPIPPPRVLDFDLENRPLSYLGGDFTTGEVTAIAWSWEGEDEVAVRLLGWHGMGAVEMLSDFVEAYNTADMVTGHYIRKHDLPVLSGAMLEAQLPVLSPKLTSDTCLDLVKHKHLSASQESLAGMFGLNEHKHHMSQAEWRDSNRLTPSGIEGTRRRVVDDVLQHKALRAKLLELGALRPPSVWSP